MIINYNSFIFENLVQELVPVFNQLDILESIVTNTTELLQSIKAEEILDFRHVFNISDILKNDSTIDFLHKNPNFVNSLHSKGLRSDTIKSNMESDTFLDKKLIINYFEVFDKNDLNNGTPEYIFFQSKQKSDNNWEPIKCYKIDKSSDMTNFYNKLTSKTIQFDRGDKKYIYSTSNGGNDWMLGVGLEEDDIFKKSLSNDDIKAILADKKNKTSITIIA